MCEFPGLGPFHSRESGMENRREFPGIRERDFPGAYTNAHYFAGQTDYLGPTNLLQLQH